MQISKFTDYAFRALIYLGSHQERLCTVEELSRELETSAHHMKKVIHRLSVLGYVEGLKGRSGGLRLAQKPGEINLGEVLKNTEENLNLYECFYENGCPLLRGGCKLKSITYLALQRFLQEYSHHTLEELL